MLEDIENRKTRLRNRLNMREKRMRSLESIGWSVFYMCALAIFATACLLGAASVGVGIAVPVVAPILLFSPFIWLGTLVAGAIIQATVFSTLSYPFSWAKEQMDNKDKKQLRQLRSLEENFQKVRVLEPIKEPIQKADVDERLSGSTARMLKALPPNQASEEAPMCSIATDKEARASTPSHGENIREVAADEKVLRF